MAPSKALRLAGCEEATLVDHDPYYDDLSDPDFFGRCSYTLKSDRAAITIAKPGIPLWETSNGANREHMLAATRGSGRSDNVPILVELIRLENAYRRGDLSLIELIGQKLNSSGDVSAARHLKKIRHAANARAAIEAESVELLGHQDLGPRDRAVAEMVAVLWSLHGNVVEQEGWTADDVFVESPVRKDFIRRQIDLFDREHLLSFYRTTLSYIFELTAANMQVETLSNYVRALEACKLGTGSRVLDYAGGIGTFAIVAATSGHRVDFAELDSITRSYALARFRNRPSLSKMIRPHIIHQDGDVPDARWDVIICTEVLEHVFEPFVLIEKLLRRLSEDGHLILSESFDHTENFCTHLPQHRGQGGRVFTQRLAGEFGLIPVLTDPSCHIKVWKNIA